MSGKKLYHYTSKEGYDGIMNDQCIRESDPAKRDAVKGKGVYFTSMEPDNDSSALSYHSFGKHDGQRNKLSHYFEVDADEVGAEKVMTRNGRNIYKTDGDVDLEGLLYNTGKREKKKHKN